MTVYEQNGGDIVDKYQVSYNTDGELEECFVHLTTHLQELNQITVRVQANLTAELRHDAVAFTEALGIYETTSPGWRPGPPALGLRASGPGKLMEI